MRSVLMSAAIGGLFLIAPAARAATWQIGPSIGLDFFSGAGSTLTTFAAPAGSDVFTGGLRPGLRLGAWDAALQNEVFLDTGVQVLSSSGETLWTSANTINYARAFGAGSAPYLTLGAGLGIFSSEGSSESFVLYGIGVGYRQRLSHGHGSLRPEFRFDRVDGTEAFTEPVNVVGVRLGFDLDLN